MIIKITMANIDHNNTGTNDNKSITHKWNNDNKK